MNFRNYNNSMQITFDPDKDATNIAKHGVSLEQADEIDWETAFIETDDRWKYGEERFRAWGYIGERLHCLVFVVREQNLRAISLRKANSREVNRYAKNR